MMTQQSEEKCSGDDRSFQNEVGGFIVLMTTLILGGIAFFTGHPYIGIVVTFIGTILMLAALENKKEPSSPEK